MHHATTTRRASARNRAQTALVAVLCAGLFAIVLVISGPLVDAQTTTVQLNEAQSSNESTLVDASGATPDWIELVNDGAAAVDLTGWSLSDSPASPARWVFPAGITIGAGELLLVFASGTDLSTPDELHTNFSLSASGEFVGLFDPAGTLVSAFDPMPALPADHSWGINADGELNVFDAPTPAATNVGGTAGFLADVDVVPGRGFYAAEQQITMTADAGASIRYTTDGSVPSATNGTLYTSPVAMAETSVLRAVAVRSGWSSPKPVTHSYLFVDDIPDQLGMDPSIVGADRAVILDGLASLPVISVTALNDDGTPRLAWSQEDESLAAVEMIFPDGTPGFQVDAGVKEVGGASVSLDKDSLRIKFDAEWGESTLDYPVFASADNPNQTAVDSFKRLTLRTGSHDSGFPHPLDSLARSFLRARWHDETMLDLGHTDAHGRFVNVFLNGEYWGQYHLRELVDDHFMAAYHGGDNTDYVGVNRGAISTGEGTSWDAMAAASANWAQFSQIVDPINYVDFMLVSEFGGNTFDLRAEGNTNWRAAGPATVGTTSTGYIFHSSDPDGSLVSTTATISDPGARSNFAGPASSWDQLRIEQDPAFMALVTERAELLFGEGGALSQSQAQARWDRLATQIEFSVHAEYARWGNLSPAVWNSNMAWFRDTLFAERTDFINYSLQDRGLLPTLAQTGVASQSSDLNGSSLAALAIDGRTSGDPLAASATSTTTESQPWWHVDLGTQQSIDSIRIWNRTDTAADQLQDFHVFVSNDPFTSDTVAGTQAQSGVSDFYFAGQIDDPATTDVIEASADFGIARSGRYVRVQLAGAGASLSLAEVQIFEGTPNAAPTITSPTSQTSVIGQAALIALSASDPEGGAITWSAVDLPAGLAINRYTGVISGVTATAGVFTATVVATDNRRATSSTIIEWTVATSPHLGEQGIATQSSTISGGVASRAIDGNLDGLWASGSVAHTALEDQAWWQVDLGAVQSIDAIRLWGRVACCPERLSNFHVFVSDVPFTSTTIAETQAQAGVTSSFFAGNAGLFEQFDIGRTGRYVRVQSEGLNYLAIAEAQILGQDRPNSAPDVVAPTAQSSTVGETAWLVLDASDPEGDPLTWSAVGLPAGLVINASSGVITGTPTQAGVFDATISVADTSDVAATTTLQWTVVAAIAPPTITPAGGAVPFGTTVMIDGVAPGVVYYTTNGADPASGNGAISTSALMYTAPLTVTESVTVKARVLDAGLWSPLVEASLSLSSSQGSLPLAVNEFNAVSSSKYLGGGGAADIGNGSDATFGRIVGNGGDWFELVTIEDGLDVRGWTVEVWNDVNGQLTKDVALTFSNDPVFNGLLAGTLLTVSEDIADDVSYDPRQNDWHINVQSNGTRDGAFITAESQSGFAINNSDTQLAVFNAAGVPVVLRTGEGTVDGLSLGSTEVFKLEGEPSTSLQTNSNLYNDGTSSTWGLPNTWAGGTQAQTMLGLRVVFGDVDCDNAVSIGDALMIAQYSVGTRTAVNSCPLTDPTSQIFAPAMDVNNDISGDIGDALIIAQCSVGLTNSFCPN